LPRLPRGYHTHDRIAALDILSPSKWLAINKFYMQLAKGGKPLRKKQSSNKTAKKQTLMEILAHKKKQKGGR
jgi:hypothetical protein